ncbi:hypothetical protein P152DRAFT_514516 [Eremomyces bilateralis CBS 781.70]|uniref:Uncharacterized protein n=1 Tax=Eremomyces bilateralis CBS 781.70 TaxID=1392243 RepID=A0A6G1G3K0_9PEZI|nr:uncharacterized protein P152DRAFT_514516 [Eremomyces bilateralis CBS 781.70]KAF1812389.1 hypothetical protein P152DRAFT_514516 [Eremomyces bilateralis CBS 781.70]
MFFSPSISAAICSGIVCFSIVGSTSVVPSPPSCQVNMDGPAAQQQVLRHISAGEAVPAEALHPLWSALPPLSVSEAIGTYRGGYFDGGKKPSPINWFGKQIASENAVNPLLCHPPGPTNGTVNKDVIFPYPRKDIARARNVEHQGVVTATIIYNKVPLMDYFRVVRPGKDLLILGKSDWNGSLAEPAYFWLERVEGVEIKFDVTNPMVKGNVTIKHIDFAEKD